MRAFFIGILVFSKVGCALGQAVLPVDRETVTLRRVASEGVLRTVEGMASVEGRHVWDLSNVVVEDFCDERWRNFGDSVLVRVWNGSQTMYKIKGDTLLMTSTENPYFTLNDYIAPIVAGRIPFTLSDGQSGGYHYCGNYCGNNALDLAGSYSITAHDFGTLILPDDTLTNVLMTCEMMSGPMTVSENRQTKTFAIRNDSVLQFNRICYKWWHEDYCHPLARVETIRYCVHGQDVSEHSVAYICPPSAQEDAVASTSSPTRTPAKKVKSQSAPVSQNITDGSADNSNVPKIRDFNIDIGDGFILVTVNIQSGSIPGEGFNIVLCDLHGRVFASYSEETGLFNKRIDTSSLPTGDYILSVNTGDCQETKRFHIK